MNQQQVNQIIDSYLEVYDFLEINADKVFETYREAKAKAYASQGEDHDIRKYDFDHIDVNSDPKTVVYERYSCGESDYMYLPMIYFFDENLEQTIFEETLKIVVERKALEDAKKQAENKQAQLREIARLKELADKYPEVIKELNA